MKKSIQKFAQKAAVHTHEYNKDKYSLDEWTEVLEYAYYKATILSLLATVLIIVSEMLKFNNNIYIFIVSFFFLRCKFGGMHLQNEKGCFTLSLMLPICTYVLFKDIYISKTVLLIIYILSTFILYKVGTVDNIVRRSEESRKIKLRNEGLLVIVLIVLINIYIKSNFIAISLILTTISCLIGKIQLKRN